MGNLFDKTFGLIADIVLKILPASKNDKQSFSYYRAGMAAQDKGRYPEALENYYEALELEEDRRDRGYILYNIGLIYANIGEHVKALEFYHQALESNANLPQAFNNIAVIYHGLGIRARHGELVAWEPFIPSSYYFDKAGEYWIKALRLAPDNYPRSRNWLKVTGRLRGE